MSKFIFLTADDPAAKRDGLAVEICEAAGVDPGSVRRMVIDLEVGSAAKVYMEMFADDAILDVSIQKLGIKVSDAEPSE